MLPHELDIAILKGEFDYGDCPDPVQRQQIDRERALEFLKMLTGEDFGDDGLAWQQWFADAGGEFVALCYEELRNRRSDDRT